MEYLVIDDVSTKENKVIGKQFNTHFINIGENLKQSFKHKSSNFKTYLHKHDKSAYFRPITEKELVIDIVNG